MLDLIPAKLEPYSIHLTSYWIYSKEYKKWFLPDEIIPIPKSSPKQLTFDYSVCWKDELNDDLDEQKVDDSHCFSSWPSISINKYPFVWEFCDCYFDVIKQMFEELKNQKYSFISIDELTFMKFLIWDCGETIRFKAQDYSFLDRVREPIDFQVDKNVFFETFIDLLNTLQAKKDTFRRKFYIDIKSISKISYSRLTL